MSIQKVIPIGTMNPRSKNITEGKSRAPNRSMYYAMGYEAGDFVKPMVGVANGHSTITPCNSGLQKHLRDLLTTDLNGKAIRVAGHCYGCTAGQGSSCGGALEH